MLLWLAGVVGVSSCVKEDQTLDPKGSTNVIEIFNEVPDVIASPTTSTYPLYVNTFAAEPGVLQDFAIVVNYTGNAGASQDINVVLELAPDALVTYNDENSEHFVELPSSLYTVDTWNLTIPKGQKKASMNLKLKTSEFDFDEEYALPVRIKTVSAGTISKNYGTMLFRIIAKNKYDGVYTLKARLEPAADRITQASTLPFTWPTDIHLITTGANSVAYFDAGYYGNYYQNFITAAGTQSGYGSFAPEFTFDATTNKIVDIVNVWGLPANGRTVGQHPTVTDNRYDPDKKIVYAAFLMKQPSWADLPIYDTLIYKGAR